MQNTNNIIMGTLGKQTEFGYGVERRNANFYHNIIETKNK